MDIVGHSWTHRGTPHAVPLVPWKISPTYHNPKPDHTYGSTHSPKKASPSWTPRATAGSSAAPTCGGGAMNALLLSYLLFLLLAMIVIAILEANDNDPYA